MNSSFIKYMLLTFFFITVLKLFYIPLVKQINLLNLGALFSNNEDDYYDPYNPIDQALCSVLGYKCLYNDERCDCKQICGPNFERFHLDEKMIIAGTERTPGMYCLPQGFDQFVTFNNNVIHTAKGWTVTSKFPFIWNGKGQQVACKSPYADNNEENYLIDQTKPLNDQKLKISDIIIDPFEVMPDGSFRYRCACHSLDYQKNYMSNLNEFPFLCVSDHCKMYTYGAAYKGWDGKQCDCGPRRGHIDPTDPTSPCAMISSIKNNDHLEHWVSCINKNSVNSEGGFYCPDKYNTDIQNLLRFEKFIHFLKDPYENLKAMRTKFKNM